MSTFSPFIGSTENLDKDLLQTALGKLGVKIYQTQYNSTALSFNSTLPSTVQTVSSCVVEAEDLVIMTSTIWVSASNSGDRWNLRQAFAGVASNGSEQVRYSTDETATDGLRHTVTLISTFQDQTPGTYSGLLQVFANSAPTGAFYTTRHCTKVFVVKRV